MDEKRRFRPKGRVSWSNVFGGGINDVDGARCTAPLPRPPWPVQVRFRLPGPGLTRGREGNALNDLSQGEGEGIAVYLTAHTRQLGTDRRVSTARIPWAWRYSSWYGWRIPRGSANAYGFLLRCCLIGPTWT